MIHFEHLTYTYPGAAEPALKDVSLELPEGELILVIGPSGQASPRCCAASTAWCPISAAARWQATCVCRGWTQSLQRPKCSAATWDLSSKILKRSL